MGVTLEPEAAIDKTSVLSFPRRGGYSRPLFVFSSKINLLPCIAGVILAEIHLNVESVDAFFPAMRGLLSGVFIKQ